MNLFRYVGNAYTITTDPSGNQPPKFTKGDVFLPPEKRNAPPVWTLGGQPANTPSAPPLPTPPPPVQSTKNPDDWKPGTNLLGPSDRQREEAEASGKAVAIASTLIGGAGLGGIGIRGAVAIGDATIRAARGALDRAVLRPSEGATSSLPPAFRQAYLPRQTVSNGSNIRILDSRGVKEILSGLPGKSGKTGPIKEVSNVKTLDDLFGRLSQGARSVNPGSYPGRVKELPDGIIIRCRPSSKSGVATIDITMARRHNHKGSYKVMTETADKIMELLSDDIISHGLIAQCVLQTAIDSIHLDEQIRFVLSELLQSEKVDVGQAKKSSDNYVEFIAWKGSVEERVERALMAVDLAHGSDKEFAYWLCLRCNIDRSEE